MAHPRWSRTGLVLCAAYGVAAAVSAACSILPSDPKAGFALLQLPLVPMLGLAAAFGVEHGPGDLSWAQAYALFVPATLAVLYGAGWGIGRLLRAARTPPGRRGPRRPG